MRNNEENLNHVSGGSDVNGNSALIGSLIGLGCLAVVLGSALVYVMRRSRISRKNDRKPTPEVLSMENVAAAAD